MSVESGRLVVKTALGVLAEPYCVRLRGYGKAAVGNKQIKPEQ